MSEPKLLNGVFRVDIDQGLAPTGPANGVFGMIDMSADALMKITWTGTISLPPGQWEVGLIQNVWNDRLWITYSKGGDIYYSFDRGAVLDADPHGSDIWIDNIASGVKKFSNNTSKDMTFKFGLAALDAPHGPAAIPGLRKRCNGKIQETLVMMERVVQFVCILGARQSGKFFTVAATGGNTYGYMWKLRPSSGAPNRDFRPFYHKTIDRGPRFSLLPDGAVIDKPVANTIANELYSKALKSYDANCAEKTPSQGTDDAMFVNTA